MKLATLRTIRNMAFVTEVFGLFANIPQAFWIGLLIYLTTFLHSVRVLEDKFLAEPEKTDEEKSDDENQGS